jgi:hypothetical protein
MAQHVLVFGRRKAIVIIGKKHFVRIYLGRRQTISEPLSIESACLASICYDWRDQFREIIDMVGIVCSKNVGKRNPV